MGRYVRTILKRKDGQNGSSETAQNNSLSGKWWLSPRSHSVNMKFKAVSEKPTALKNSRETEKGWLCMQEILSLFKYAYLEWRSRWFKKNETAVYDLGRSQIARGFRELKAFASGFPQIHKVVLRPPHVCHGSYALAHARSIS